METLGSTGQDGNLDEGPVGRFRTDSDEEVVAVTTSRPARPSDPGTDREIDPGTDGGTDQGAVPDAAVREQAAAIVDALRTYVMETDRYIGERGGAAGLHRTDLDALTHVLAASHAGRTMTPGALSDLLRLSPPATSALLARLEQVGHVRRTHSATDRRRVEIEVEDQALEVAEGVFRPLGTAMGRMIAQYDEADRETVLRFLRDAVRVTREARGAAGDTSEVPVLPSTGRPGRRPSTGRG